MVLRERSFGMVQAAVMATGLLAAGCVSAVAPPPPNVPGVRADAAGQSGAVSQVRATPTGAAAAATAPARVATAVPARPEADASPTVAPTPTSTARLRTAVVRRGSIVDEVLANGRVAGAQEIPLSFAVDGTVKTIDVKPGQQVSAGQPVAELDVGSTTRDIEALRNRIELETVRLGATQQQAQTLRHTGTADAEDAVRRAEADLQRVQAGASLADRKAAEGAVIAAQAALDKANADVNKLKSGAAKAELDAAAQRVAAAQLSLQRAENDRATLVAGPRPDALQAGQRELAQAQAGLALAQGELDRLTKGPAPADVHAAERAVQQTEAALKAAQTAKAGGDGLSQEQKDANVASALTAFLNAKDHLAQLNEPPRQALVDAAKDRVAEATAAVAAAQARLDALRAGPSKAALDAADAQVRSEQMALEVAQQQLRDLQAGPSDDQLSAAMAAIDGAQLALEGAQARLDDVNGRPTPAELADAQMRLNAARARLQGVQSGSDDPRAVDLLTQQKTLEQDRQQLQRLQATLDSAILRAPIAGLVVSIDVQPSETVDTTRRVAVVSPSADAVVRTMVNQPGSSSSAVRVGQQATIQLDGTDGTPLPATVRDVDDNPDGPGQVAVLQVDWGATRPVFATTAVVRIKVQEKTDVLIVPARAIRKDGDKRYVEYLSGGAARTAEVQVGVISFNDVEVLSGLQEGQQVFLGGPSGPQPES